MPTCVCPDGCRSYCVDRCAGDESPTPKAATSTPFGIPVSAFWPDHEEELLALREFRADYDRLMSTEGQSHGEAIAALSGLVASVRQREHRNPDPLSDARAALDAFTEDSRAIVARRLAGKRTAAPMNRFFPNGAGYLRRALAEVDRLTTALTESEARCDALADRVTAAEGRLGLAAMGREVARD